MYLHPLDPYSAGGVSSWMWKQHQSCFRPPSHTQTTGRMFDELQVLKNVTGVCYQLPGAYTNACTNDLHK